MHRDILDQNVAPEERSSTYVVESANEGMLSCIFHVTIRILTAASSCSRLQAGSVHASPDQCPVRLTLRRTVYHLRPPGTYYFPLVGPATQYTRTGTYRECYANSSEASPPIMDTFFHYRLLGERAGRGEEKGRGAASESSEGIRPIAACG